MGRVLVAAAVLRIERVVVPDRVFTQDELDAAWEAADLGRLKIPGTRGRMHGHELRGILAHYLVLAGGKLDGPDGVAWLVPDQSRPFVEAIRKAWLGLWMESAPADGFQILQDGER